MLPIEPKWTEKDWEEINKRAKEIKDSDFDEIEAEPLSEKRIQEIVRYVKERIHFEDN